MSKPATHYLKNAKGRTFCGRDMATVRIVGSLDKVTCVRCHISGQRAAKAKAARQARMFANND